MDSSRVVAVFRGREEIEVSAIWQYSYGIKLILSDLELPDSYEVQFGESRTAATVTMIGDAYGVEIPPALLDTAGVKYAWLFAHDGAEDGYTKKVVRIPVNARGPITDAEPAPEEQGVITQTVAALQDAVGKAEQIAEEMPGEIEAALQEAKDSGEFDGADGVTFTPSVSEEGVISWTNDGDRENPESVDIKGPPGEPGKPGADGVSPTIAVTEVTGGHEVTVTDAEGAQTFRVMDGAPGAKGDPGKKGNDGFSPIATVTQTESGAEISVTDRNGATTSEVKNGKDGEDGVSPTVNVSTITGGHRIAVTDAQGTETFDVMDGEKGAPGNPGTPGTPGTDGVTFIPTVSEAGIISWTNDGGRQNPQSVDIKGPQGDDYVLTAQDKADIAAIVGADMVVSISGATPPPITAQAGYRYECGEVSTLSFTPSASGCCDVVFTSGSTPTALTVPETVQWPDWFNPNALEANATYELSVLNGKLGTVGIWM